MGFSYAINPFTGYQTLSCDFCDGFRGYQGTKWVKKIPCPYGYCQAWAVCDKCYAQGKHKQHSSADPTDAGKWHESCRVGMGLGIEQRKKSVYVSESDRARSYKRRKPRKRSDSGLLNTPSGVVRSSDGRAEMVLYGDESEKPEKIIYKGIIKVMPKDVAAIRGEEDRTGNLLTDAYDDHETPNWSNRAQELIDFDRARGKQSYVLHRGRMHYHFTNW